MRESSIFLLPSTPFLHAQGDDITITKSGPSSVVSGANIEYALEITNNSGSAIEIFDVTDTLPTNTTFVSASNEGFIDNGVVVWQLDLPLNPGEKLK